MLTKSLHTVTAALAVARFALSTGRVPASASADYLARYSLSILGYSQDFAVMPGAAPDPTFARIVAGCAKIFAEGQS